MEESRDVEIVVLKMSISEADAIEIIEQKKINQFGSIFSKIKKEEIYASPPELYYECILRVAGRYAANYYRTRTHTITVSSNVREVVLGDRVFSVNTKSKFKKIITGKHGKNKVDVTLEEHVFIEEEGELAFDRHGAATEFPFKMDSKAVESYPSVTLENDKTVVRDTNMSHDLAVQKLEQLLKVDMGDDVRDVQEEFVLQQIAKVYVPIFESRLSGPEKEGIIRIDAVRKKIV